MQRLIALLCIYSLIVLSFEVKIAGANHTVVNPYLKSPALDRYYAGDRVTVLMNFSTGALVGDEVLDSEGKVGYDAKITLQSINPPDSLTRPYSIGLAVAPENDFLQANFQIPVDLTAGKWRIVVYFLEHKTTGNVSIFTEPQVLDFEIYPKPASLTPDYTLYYFILGIIASIAIGYYFYWRQKRDSYDNKPVIHWEWFKERVSADGTITKIRIQVKEGHAPRVSVSINGEPLTWEKNGQKEFNMSGGDGGNLIIPPEQVSLDSQVMIKVNDHQFMKDTLGDIPRASG